MQTIFFFDWDDTFFPTTDLEQKKEIDWSSLATEILRVFKEIEKLGLLIIVTNSENGWVMQSARKYMPSIVKELQKTEILSARSMYEGKKDLIENGSTVKQMVYAANQMAKNKVVTKNKSDYVKQAEQTNWKFLTFLSVLAKFYHYKDLMFQLVSVGDSVTEKNALSKIGSLDLPIVKSVQTIKFCNSPSSKQIEQQLKQFRSEIRKIISSKEKHTSFC
jgi:hypothetical protein